MENNSDHFLGDSLGFQTFEEKVDFNNISVEHIAESLITPPRTSESKSSVECPVCFVQFTQKNNLSRHMQRFHGVKPPRSRIQPKVDDSLLGCSECGMKFTRKSNLFRHMKKFHEFSPPPKNPELPKIYGCTECERKFTQWKNCLRHIRNIHSVGGSPKEEVDQVSVKSESNPALEDNLEYVIEVDPFPVVSSLRVETVSSEQTDLPESVPSNEIQLPERNSNHERESNTKKSSKVICAECGDFFSSPSNLRRHTKRIHEEKANILGVGEAMPEVQTTTLKETPLADESDYKLLLRTCSVCHVRFSSPFNLRRHMKRVHAGLDLAADSACRKKSGSSENRLHCPLCTESSVSFSTPFNLRRHMKRAHPQNQLEKVVAASPAVDQTASKACAGADKNRLSCPLCPEGCVSFSTPSNLRRHMRRFHQQEENSITEVEEPLIDTSEIMKCPRCDYRENRLNLYVHFNLVHGLQVIIEYQVFDSETQLDEWLSQISPEAQFVVRKSDSNRMVISCSHPNRADEFCPAEMIILTESDKCTVHYVKTHVHES